MQLLKLDINQAPLIVDQNYHEAGLLSLVVGNQSETFLDRAVLASDISQTSICQKTIDRDETEALFDILDDMMNDQLCYSYFHDMLVAANSLFKEIEPNNGEGKYNFRYHFRFKDCVSTKTQIKLLKYTPPLFQTLVGIGLQAYKPLNGQAFIYNMDKIKIKYGERDTINIKIIIDYLAKIAEARGSRIIISTNSMIVLKTFNEFMLDNPKIESAIITMADNTPENCKILKQAKIEADLFRSLLA